MASVIQDFRYAFRLLLKSPGFTVVAVLTLGAGIGANVTVFSVLNAVLVRSLPLPQPQQLVRLYSEWEPAWPVSAVSAPHFLDWQERNTTLSSPAAFRVRGITFQQTDRAERIMAGFVAGKHFPMF